MSTPEPEGYHGPFADPLPPELAASFASWASAQAVAADEPVPYTLADQPELISADAAAEYEAEWADEWDSADSAAYMDRVEAGLEPEAEP